MLIRKWTWKADSLGHGAVLLMPLLVVSKMMTTSESSISPFTVILTVVDEDEVHVQCGVLNEPEVVVLE